MSSFVQKTILRFRRILPERLKYLGRLARYMCSKPHTGSELLDQDLVDGCMVFSCREVMLGSLPKGGVIGEVGVWRGDRAVIGPQYHSG